MRLHQLSIAGRLELEEEIKHRERQIHGGFLARQARERRKLPRLESYITRITRVAFVVGLVLGFMIGCGFAALVLRYAK